MRTRLGVIAIACVLVAAATAEGQDTTDYSIGDYEMTVELQPGTPAARITLNLAYQIRSGTKSEGFKYIGTFEPMQLEGSEADGRPMRMSIEHQRETLIRWRFTPAGSGTKRVRVSFTIANALAGTRTENVFRASWAGVFKVPVGHAAYRLVLPAGWEEDAIVTVPSDFTRTEYNGRQAIEVEQRPLREPSFVVTLRPGLAGTSTVAAPIASTPRSRSAPLEVGIPFESLFLLALILVVVIAVARAKRGVGRGSSAGSTSSCAGGSSCSSSCGGGGCGGGCGG